MGRLTTHVLDTAAGRPAAGLQIRLENEAGKLLAQARTNADGRLDAPMMEGATFSTGRFRLIFSVAAYFRAQGVTLPEPPFLDEVIIAFGMAEDAHYHVPLLVSPFAFSTYRGS